jgi:hypothetical protein
MIGLPAMFRDSATWSLELRKEDNALRGILREDGASTPEDPGAPCFLLYGPRAFIKLHCESSDVASCFLLYGSMPEITEKVHSLEWAFIASIAGGTIPEKHRLVPTVQVLNPVKFDTEIFNQGHATQAYDKGLE